MFAVLPAWGLGSSDEAWREFRAAVERSCRALVQAPGNAEVEVEVNAFGSENHGAALVTAGRDRMICILEKTTGRAELTAPFTDAAD